MKYRIISFDLKTTELNVGIRVWIDISGFNVSQDGRKKIKFFDTVYFDKVFLTIDTYRLSKLQLIDSFVRKLLSMS